MHRKGMPKDILTKINLFLLVLIVTQSKYSPYYKVLKTNSAFSTKFSNSSGCTFGSGSINNSTIIELGNCDQQLYFIRMGLGSNNQLFNFQFDTGSNTLWIPLLESTINQTGFNSNQSTTYNLTKQTGNITYADNSSVSGQIGYDMIQVPQTNISITGSILFASNVSNMHFPPNVIGLVGMGFTSQQNFLDIAYQNKQIKSSAFALDLNYNNQTSYMYYNGLPQFIAEKTYWISQSEGNYWQVQIIGMSVGGIDFISQASDTVIIDSGTSIFLLNQDLYKAVVEQFFSDPSCAYDSYSDLICPCNQIQWPTFSFMFLGVQVYIPGSAYMIQNGNGNCVVGFSYLGTVDSILLGDTFFRGYTVSFDKMNSQIGFYGNTRQVFIIDTMYFIISQYVVCGLFSALAILGLTLSISSRVSFKRKNLQSNLDVELM